MRALSMLVVLSALICLPGLARAQAQALADRAYPVKVAWKLKRGLTNVLFSLEEIPVNMFKEHLRASYDRGNNFADRSVATCVGFVTGTGYTIARIAVGAFDVATFPIPSRPIMMPGAPDTFAEVYLQPHNPPRGIEQDAPGPHRCPNPLGVCP